jgi:hypothetical protein
LNKHKEVSFIIEDVARAEARPDVMAGLRDRRGAGAAEQIGTDLLTLASRLTYSVGTYNERYRRVARSARKKLNDNKAPFDGRHLILSSKDEDSILVILPY